MCFHGIYQTANMAIVVTIRGMLFLNSVFSLSMWKYFSLQDPILNETRQDFFHCLHTTIKLEPRMWEVSSTNSKEILIRHFKP